MKYAKKALAVLLAVCLTLMGLWYGNRVLVTKLEHGVIPMQNFYEQPEDSIDVLLMGSSHVGLNLDTGILWENYGISSYALWGSEQPLWNTYYWLEEVLKTQSPKVVVLDVYATVFGFEYSGDVMQIANISGMRTSLTKWKAIKVTAPKERWLNLLLGYPIFHGFYDELTEDDFSHFPWTEGLAEDKGTRYLTGSGEFEVEDPSEITEIAPIEEKNVEYLKKIIALCAEEQIPLLLVKTNTTGASILQPTMNTVAEIATDYGVEFLNFNLLTEEIGLDAEDYATDGGHLNSSGARKNSDYLGKILVERYGVEDHRGDAMYDSWENSIQAQWLREEWIETE